MNWKIGTMIVVGGLVGGCFTPDPKSIYSDSAPSEIPAIKDAADKNDRTAIPRLVQDLSVNDPAVRFAAITALKRMTGQDMGYVYYDNEFDRRPAVERWQKWLKDHPSPNH